LESPAAPRRIGRADAAQIATTEYARLLSLLRSIDPTDWHAPTDCPGWDVRAMVAHLVGAAEACSYREYIRLARVGAQLAKARGVPEIDGINAMQVSERSNVGPAELIVRLQAAAPRFVAFRLRVPGLLRGLRVPTPVGKVSVGHLVDVIYSRDVWLHRVDIARATGRQMVQTAEHDGWIVGDVVADWAARHGRPFVLHLEGIAGGDFAQGRRQSFRIAG